MEPATAVSYHSRYTAPRQRSGQEAPLCSGRCGTSWRGWACSRGARLWPSGTRSRGAPPTMRGSSHLAESLAQTGGPAAKQPTRGRSRTRSGCSGCRWSTRVRLDSALAYSPTGPRRARRAAAREPSPRCGTSAPSPCPRPCPTTLGGRPRGALGAARANLYLWGQAHSVASFAPTSLRRCG